MLSDMPEGSADYNDRTDDYDGDYEENSGSGDHRIGKLSSIAIASRPHIDSRIFLLISAQTVS